MPTWLKTSTVRARGLAGEAAMQQQDLGDLLFDRVQRIERGHRFLEHDGDVVAAYAPHVAFGEAQQLAALEGDAARGMARHRVGQELEVDSAVTDLPEPDSPTSATVSPLPMSNDTRSTASVARPAMAESDR